MEKEKRLSDSVADEILNMITIEKRFRPGDKLPNENELSTTLQISRTTLREAIRILATNGILEIQRGRGTFVAARLDVADNVMLEPLTAARDKMTAKDLYEMRLIFEPEAAYLAALRATERERRRIADLGRQVEEKLVRGENRANEEQAFHKSIAKATHNEFMRQLMPVIYKAIDKGILLSENNDRVAQDTLTDHRMIVNFLEAGNAEGARCAMKIHILHAMQNLGLDTDLK
ncbi:MAG: FadR family transcriptional regulator [Oscillospiraceae bacterium]|jgi:DNA-binding FadR family transcriptional regulator|nr:FadR family transcriptional regulator [Oscillospiraceae bacterium]